VTAPRGSAAPIWNRRRIRRRKHLLCCRVYFAVAAFEIQKAKSIMMILRSAPPSPFGRKVQIALSLLGFDDVKIEATDTMDAASPLRQQNPLGKIPVLITEDGTPYYDSRVIDDRAGGGKIIPGAAAPRLAALRLQALCDGILDFDDLRGPLAHSRQA
jgi:glutathione S-transferase